MLDLDASPFLRFLFHVARRRVIAGFAVAVVAFAGARPSWRSLAAGVPIALAGEVLRIWAAGHLVKGREVTMSGPYRLLRHPLYAGSALIGAGFAVAAASPLVAGVVLGYLAVMTAAAVRLEEATLRADFGDTYRRYAAGELTSPPFSSPLPSPLPFLLSLPSLPSFHHMLLPILPLTHRSALQSDAMCPPPPQRVQMILDVTFCCSGHSQLR